MEANEVKGSCSGQVPVQLEAPTNLLKDPGAQDVHTDASVVELAREDCRVELCADVSEEQTRD